MKSPTIRCSIERGSLKLTFGRVMGEEGEEREGEEGEEVQEGEIRMAN